MKSKSNRIIWAILALIVILSLIVLAPRYNAERVTVDRVKGEVCVETVNIFGATTDRDCQPLTPQNDPAKGEG